MYTSTLHHFPTVLKYFQGLTPLGSSQIVARFRPRLREDYLAVGQIVVPASGLGPSIPLQRRCMQSPPHLDELSGVYSMYMYSLEYSHHFLVVSRVFEDR